MVCLDGYNFVMWVEILFMKVFIVNFMNGIKNRSEKKIVMIFGIKMSVIFCICVKVWKSVIISFMFSVIIMIGVDVLSKI